MRGYKDPKIELGTSLTVNPNATIRVEKDWKNNVESVALPERRDNISTATEHDIEIKPEHLVYPKTIKCVAKFNVFQTNLGQEKNVKDIDGTSSTELKPYADTFAPYTAFDLHLKLKDTPINETTNTSTAFYLEEVLFKNRQSSEQFDSLALIPNKLSGDSGWLTDRSKGS